ncbi:MAG: hypothetical protein GX811_01365 [Lentisphaerae bacterium]|jgi:tetratricopeptide (TPR) repeat protein|nr:hypothetical protein [Lentisphaerota bacterium]
MKRESFLTVLIKKTAVYVSLPAVAVLLLTSLGCASSQLDSARSHYFAGRLQAADDRLEELPDKGGKDEVLFLMERGTIRQELGKYDESANDLRKAAELIKGLDTYSLSRGATSLLTDDNVLSFKGKPFEHTLLYATLAKNYMALGNWDFVGISGRNILEHLEQLDGYPDIAYGRYMAGVCLDIMNDPGNAAIQYRKVREIVPSIAVDPDTGFIFASTTLPKIVQENPESPEELVDPKTSPPPAGMPSQLICFFGASTYSFSNLREGQSWIEIYANGLFLGSGFVLSDTSLLMAATKQRELAKELGKTALRIATKESISAVVSNQNEVLGALTRLLLYSTERPDTRHWETLPRILGVAKVYCPEKLTSVEVHFKNATGKTLLKKTIVSPLVRRGNTWYAFFTDIIPSAE